MTFCRDRRVTEPSVFRGEVDPALRRAIRLECARMQASTLPQVTRDCCPVLAQCLPRRRAQAASPMIERYRTAKPEPRRTTIGTNFNLAMAQFGRVTPDLCAT
jgi:hypothetical protein